MIRRADSRRRRRRCAAARRLSTREYDEYTPGVEALTKRARRADRRRARSRCCSPASRRSGSPSCASVPSIWSDGLEAYLEELYVAPDRRGEGFGRELLDAAIELARERGASYLELNTSEDDTAALGLYESAGFTNREGRPDGPKMLYYEREL